ncbi:uncharacterized protein LOC127094985 [Lathyrus oleraceus]|uniref:uncharacterized protein LOC127094985 n=1 Tax=Pisum sativum TaxID=3888 RepID=UPI0021D347BC|nr:uncharacterized protein LOC127094985 [Pisum sativum]
MTSEAFKLKSLSEQVNNDFIREAGERLQARLVRETEENAIREAEEKAHQEEEQRVREAAEKVAAESEAKAKADAEEAAHIAAEEVAKASNDALAQGEQSNSDFAPLVLKTLEELQKEQQIVRARLDHQDSVNNIISMRMQFSSSGSPLLHSSVLSLALLLSKFGSLNYGFVISVGAMMEENESVGDFFTRVTRPMNQIKMYDEVMPSRSVVENVLISLLQKFDHVVIAIEESKDMSSRTKEELQGTIESHEQKIIEIFGGKTKSDTSLQEQSTKERKRKGMTINLLSIGELIEKNYKVVIEGKMMRVHDSSGRLILREPMSQNRTFKIELYVIEHKCLVTVASRDE